MISLFKFLMGTSCRVATFCPLLRLVWTSFFLLYPKFSTYVRTSALFGFRKKKPSAFSAVFRIPMRNYISGWEKKSYLNSRSLTWCDNFGRSVKRFFFFSVIHILGAQGEEISQRRLYSLVPSRLGRGVGLWRLHFDLQWGLVSGGMHCQL